MQQGPKSDKKNVLTIIKNLLSKEKKTFRYLMLKSF